MILKRLFLQFLAAALAFTGFAQTVQAALIGTDQVARAPSTPTSPAEHRARLAAALDRPEVVEQLQHYGISRADAEARVAALSDDEAVRLGSQIENAPAGGIIGAILLVFFVLLITDVLGFTKVYPFTRSIR